MTKVNDKSLKKIERAVITDLFHRGLTKGEVKTRYDISGREYKRILEMALNSGKITPEQDKRRISVMKGHRLKADKKTVEHITYDVFNNHMTKSEICAKYNISKSVFGRAMHLSVDYGFISNEQMIEYLASAGIRGYETRVQNLGTKVLEEMKSHGTVPKGDIALLTKELGEEEMCRRLNTGREEWNGSHLDILESNARKGGKETQKEHGEKVRGNLRRGNSYGKNLCYYGETEFHSDGERFTGLLLVEIGLISEIITGENFHKHIYGKTEVDFYIDDNLIVEYHPPVKEHKGIESLTGEEYTSQRMEQFNGNFNGKIVSITKNAATEYYKKLELGPKMTFSEFMKKYHTVEEKLEKYDTEMKEMDTFFEKQAEENKQPDANEEPF